MMPAQPSTFLESFLKQLGFPGDTVVKNTPATGDARDVGSIPGLGRYPRVGSGSALQYAGLELHGHEKPGRLQSMGCKESDRTEHACFLNSSD